ncbi:Seipin-2 [Euphorbia peplus]|nr:Seipin-2 [Euphorbia peplus]
MEQKSDQIHEISDQFEDNFFDSFDYFHFHDGSIADKSNPTTSGESSPSVSSPATTCPGTSCISSETIQSHKFTEQFEKIYRDLKENEKNLEDSVLTQENFDTQMNLDRPDSFDDDSKKILSEDEFGDSSYVNLFVFIAGLVVKAIDFKVNLFYSLLTVPVWGLYNSYMLLVDPFGVFRRGRRFFLKKLIFLWDMSGGSVSPLIFGSLKDQESIWKLVLRFGVAMKLLVENPIEIRDELNFDYTQKSPVAFVPVMSCGGVGCGLDCGEKSLGSRVIPPYQKLQVNLQLTLPESTYNKNLGVFQVRVDLLSADGKILASKRQPCMLMFKSEFVQTVITFFKIAPLITGYMSETQTLKVNIRGITEGNVPTSCIKVVLEQRAEYQPGAGIPEIYDASLKLESELPFVKRMIWGWRKTMFVWISMMLFIVKLMFALLCCRSFIMPRTRQRHVPSATDSTLQDFTKLS